MICPPQSSLSHPEKNTDLILSFLMVLRIKTMCSMVPGSLPSLSCFWTCVTQCTAMSLNFFQFLKCDKLLWALPCMCCVLGWTAPPLLSLLLLFRILLKCHFSGKLSLTSFLDLISLLDAAWLPELYVKENMAKLQLMNCLSPYLSCSRLLR